MTIRESTAVWNGNLVDGKGRLSLGSGEFTGDYSFASRFEEGKGTNPEELIGAANAGCFSMFLASLLAKEGHTPKTIKTSAKVHLGEGPKITLIELSTVGDVPGVDEKTFIRLAEQAKKECPVSQALAAVEIKLTAQLAS